MNRRQFPSTIVAFAMLFPGSESSAQSGTKMTVIGLLDAGERREWWDAFQEKLRELGYLEGRNVSFERRYAKGKLESLPAMANELVQLKVAVIVTSSSIAAVDIVVSAGGI